MTIIFRRILSSLVLLVAASSASCANSVNESALSGRNTEEVAKEHVSDYWEIFYRDWEPETTVTLAPATDEEAMELREKHLDQYRLSPSLETVRLPEIELERWINPSERWEIEAQCLNDAGFDVQVTEDESGVTMDWETEPTEEMETAYALASYSCAARFTPEAESLRKWTSQQHAVMYEYNTTFYVDCLAAHGVEVTAVAPTKESFISAHLTQDSDAEGYWVPQWEENWEFPHDGSINVQDLQNMCPQLPPLKYLYGD